METQFTKGEWTTKGKYQTEGHVFSKNGNDERLIASCMGYSSNIDNGKHIKENIANAKLIAAAPTMYEKHNQNDELCGQMLDLIKYNREALDLLIKIKSNCCTAIQKATE